MIGFLTKYLWQGTAVALAVSLSGSLIKGCSTERELTKTKVTLSAQEKEVERLGRVLADERAASAAKLVKAQDEAREKQEELQVIADQTRKESNEKINRLESRAADISQRLHVAEARAKFLANNFYDLSSTPKATGVGSDTGTGIGDLIPRRIGQEEVAEFKRADRYRIALQQCQRLYTEARGKLNAMNKGD